MEDIAFASPGKRERVCCSSSYPMAPILYVLDQPEDDLDCLMLSMSVIPAIMSNKKRRQLIIVSHSAPIVVNGDAEYVISMQHDRTGLYPGLCGALQESSDEGTDMPSNGGEKKRFVRAMSVFLAEERNRP